MDKEINNYFKLINKNLSEVYKEGPISLVSPISHVLNHPGKRIRPLLTMTVSNAFSKYNELDTLNVALAVELLHNFTLVHDDIMDQDKLRHGQPTVHVKWDNSTAILTGDALLSLSLSKLNEIKTNHKTIISAFTKGLIAVCEGQALDKEYELMERINKEQYSQMTKLKTGYLIGLSAELGAIVGGATKSQIENIKFFGDLIGKAFQIQDDLLEVLSTKQEMGKTLGTDLLLLKKTYVIIECFSFDKNRTEIILNLAKEDLFESKKQLQQFIEETGIDKEIKNEIDRLIAKANMMLHSLDIDLHGLEYFSEMIKNRKA